jgi:hypothetical protein
VKHLYRHLAKIFLITGVLLLLPGNTLHAAVSPDAACYNCHYEAGSFWWVGWVTAECVLPANNTNGMGIECKIVYSSDFFSSVQDCEFSGGQCLYIEVGSARRAAATKMAADRLRRAQKVANCF